MCRAREHGVAALSGSKTRCSRRRVFQSPTCLDALGEVQELSPGHLFVEHVIVSRKSLRPCTDRKKREADGAENHKDHTGQPVNDSEDLEDETPNTAEISIAAPPPSPDMAETGPGPSTPPPRSTRRRQVRTRIRGGRAAGADTHPDRESLTAGLADLATKVEPTVRRPRPASGFPRSAHQKTPSRTPRRTAPLPAVRAATRLSGSAPASTGIQRPTRGACRSGDRATIRAAREPRDRIPAKPALHLLAADPGELSRRSSQWGVPRDGHRVGRGKSPSGGPVPPPHRHLSRGRGLHPPCIICALQSPWNRRSTGCERPRAARRRTRSLRSAPLGGRWEEKCLPHEQPRVLPDDAVEASEEEGRSR